MLKSLVEETIEEIGVPTRDGSGQRRPTDDIMNELTDLLGTYSEEGAAEAYWDLALASAIERAGDRIDEERRGRWG